MRYIKQYMNCLCYLLNLEAAILQSGLLLALLYNKDLNRYACIPVHLVGHQTASYVEDIAFLTSTEGCACVRSAASLVPSPTSAKMAAILAKLGLGTRLVCCLHQSCPAAECSGSWPARAQCERVRPRTLCRSCFGSS